MESSESAIEASQLAADGERDRAVERTRLALAETGAEDCIGCGKPIPAVRRAALPSATRCVPCQTILERSAR